MNEPNREFTPGASVPLLQRIFNRRQAPKLLFAMACLATLAVLLLTLAGRRAASARPSPVDGAPAAAERAAAEKLVPPPVPDDQNFAATPFLARIMEDSSARASDDVWPEEFARALQWPQRAPTLAESVDGRTTGRFPIDMLAWKKTFEYVFDGNRTADNREEVAVSDRPDPTTNAQAALAVLAALKPYEPALAELHEARKRPYSRYKVKYDWENPWGILLPQLAVMKRTCQMLRLKSCAELAVGKSEEALQDVLLMLRLIDASRDEPTLISQLVRVAALDLAFQPIWEGLAMRRWSETQLQSLQTALQQVNFIADLHRVLEAERTWANLTIALIRDKRTPNLFASMMTEDGKTESWVNEADKAFQKCPRDWFEAEQRNYTRLCEERLLKGYDVAAKRAFPRMADENAHLLEKALRKKETLLQEHLVFAKALLIAPAKVHLKFAGMQGYADLAVVACALERHRLATGQFPEALAALAPRFLNPIPHDLVTGQALHYQRTDDGQFLLYSVGWNEADDGGELAFLASGRSPEKKEGDWVWRYPSATTRASAE